MKKRILTLSLALILLLSVAAMPVHAAGKPGYTALAELLKAEGSLYTFFGRSCYQYSLSYLLRDSDGTTDTVTLRLEYYPSDDEISVYASPMFPVLAGKRSMTSSPQLSRKRRYCRPPCTGRAPSLTACWIRWLRPC